MAFALAGNVGASPIPRRNRAPNKPPRPVEMAAAKEGTLQTKLAARPGKRKDSLDRNNSRVRRNRGAKQCPTVSSVRREPADVLVASKDHPFLSPCRAKYSGEPHMETRGTMEVWRKRR